MKTENSFERFIKILRAFFLGIALLLIAYAITLHANDYESAWFLVLVAAIGFIALALVLGAMPWLFTSKKRLLVIEVFLMVGAFAYYEPTVHGNHMAALFAVPAGLYLLLFLIMGNHIKRRQAQNGSI